MRELNANVSGRQLMVIIIALVALVGGYFAVRGVLQNPTQPGLEEGRITVDAFLAKLRDADPGIAWDMASTEFKSIEGRQSFSQKARSTTFLQEPFQFGSTQDVRVGDSPRTEFLYTSTKSGKTLRVLVGYESGEWRVDRLTF